MFKRIISKIIKKAVLIISIIFIILSSFFITINTPSLSDGAAVIIKDEFILPFIGGFTGFSIAIITFLYSCIERIRESLKSKNKEVENAEINKKILRVFSELFHDTVTIFIALVFCFFLIIIREMDVPLVSLNINGISKQQIISTCEISFLLLTFISLIDIMGSLFNLVKASLLIRDNK